MKGMRGSSSLIYEYVSKLAGTQSLHFFRDIQKTYSMEIEIDEELPLVDSLAHHPSVLGVLYHHLDDLLVALLEILMHSLDGGHHMSGKLVRLNGGLYGEVHVVEIDVVVLSFVLVFGCRLSQDISKPIHLRHDELSQLLAEGAGLHSSLVDKEDAFDVSSRATKHICIAFRIQKENSLEHLVLRTGQLVVKHLVESKLVPQPLLALKD